MNNVVSNIDDRNVEAEPEEPLQLNGDEHQETMPEKERNADRRVPVDEETFQAALRIRALVQKKTRMRPDVSIVVSGMIRHAVDSPDVVDAVARYGLILYTARTDTTTRD